MPSIPFSPGNRFLIPGRKPWGALSPSSEPFDPGREKSEDFVLVEELFGPGGVQLLTNRSGVVLVADVRVRSELNYCPRRAVQTSESVVTIE